MRTPRVTIVHGIAVLASVIACASAVSAQAVQKKAVFGGSGPTAGWGAIGVIVRDAMKSYGWDIELCTACAGAERAARLVAAAAVPPQGNPNDPPQPKGRLDFGATGSQYLWWAYQGTHGFARDPEGPRTKLRLIANIQSQSYLLAAVKADSGITDLRQIKDKRLPVRILTFMRDGDLAQTILAYYGLTKAELESFGGSLAGSDPPDRKSFDIVLGFAAMNNMPEYEAWVDLSQRVDLTYLELPQPLRAQLSRDFDWDEGYVPLGLLRRVDRRIPAVVRTGIAIYGRDDMPDDLAYTLARALDEHQDLLQWSNVTYSYNPHTVGRAYGVPLHPGARRYYQERRYLE